LGQLKVYTESMGHVDCKSEGHFLRVKTGIRDDVHFCKRAGIK
jgi:hypothetical protein